MEGGDVSYTHIKLTVVCRHRGQGRPRIINRMVWTEDLEMETTLRGGVDADSAAVEMLILNDRFGWYHEHRNRQGRVVQYPNPEVVFTSWQDPAFKIAPRDPDAPVPDAGAVERAGALKGFRFLCEQCGVDRPVRQDRVDQWVRGELEKDPTWRALELEISELLLS